MRKVSGVEYKPGSKEELLPDFDEAFPCISTVYPIPEGAGAPWHWHSALELFYVEHGCIEYITPAQRHSFCAGSGGLLLPDIPHMSLGHGGTPADLQLIHLFDPQLISGQPGSRIEKKYMLPLLEGPELLCLDPQDPEAWDILELIRESFRIEPQAPGYEILLRELLSRICLTLAQKLPPERGRGRVRTPELLRQILIYIHAHYAEKLTVEDLARAACVSERVCFKLFEKHMDMTPMEYVNNCRLRAAGRMLRQTDQPIAAIAAACGFQSGSYFTQIFRQVMGISPREYRKNAFREETE